MSGDYNTCVGRYTKGTTVAEVVFTRITENAYRVVSEDEGLTNSYEMNAIVQHMMTHPQGLGAYVMEAYRHLPPYETSAPLPSSGSTDQRQAALTSTRANCRLSPALRRCTRASGSWCLHLGGNVIGPHAKRIVTGPALRDSGLPEWHLREIDPVVLGNICRTNGDGAHDGLGLAPPGSVRRSEMSSMFTPILQARSSRTAATLRPISRPPGSIRRSGRRFLACGFRPWKSRERTIEQSWTQASMLSLSLVKRWVNRRMESGSALSRTGPPLRRIFWIPSTSHPTSKCGSCSNTILSIS